MNHLVLQENFRGMLLVINGSQSNGGCFSMLSQGLGGVLFDFRNFFGCVSG